MRKLPLLHGLFSLFPLFNALFVKDISPHNNVSIFLLPLYYTICSMVTILRSELVYCTSVNRKFQYIMNKSKKVYFL